jgi:hypothetical protein
MPRRKKPMHEPNAFLDAAADLSRPSYARDAGRILYGKHDVQVPIAVPGGDADGNLVLDGNELDIGPDPDLVRWVDALTDFDKNHKKELLVAELLDPTLNVLPIVNGWLADLLTRYTLKKKQTVSQATQYERQVLALVGAFDDLPGTRSTLSDLMSRRQQLASMIERFDFIRPPHRPRVPAYDLSEAEVLLHHADAMVRNRMTAGSRLNEALAAAAAKYNVDPDLIRNFHTGRRGNTRRIKARSTRP